MKGIEPYRFSVSIQQNVRKIFVDEKRKESQGEKMTAKEEKQVQEEREPEPGSHYASFGGRVLSESQSYFIVYPTSGFVEEREVYSMEGIVSS